MSTPDEPIGQPLAEALIRWCDKDRLEAVIKYQSYFSEAELRVRGFIALCGPQILAEARRHDQSDKRDNRAALSRDEQLRIEWDLLTDDFKSRIRCKEITLTGILSSPTRNENRVTLPSAWASEFRFDFINDRIRVGAFDRYVAVTAFKGRPDQIARAIGVASPAAVAPVALTADIIAELDDEQLLTLLEAHAARVIKNGTPMIAPSRISWVPIAMRKMRDRASKGELEATLAAETTSLHNWLKTVTNGYQLPTPKSLTNALRAEYRAYGAQSKGIKA